MQVWNQLFRSTATQKKYLSLCLSLSSLSIQNDGKVCNNHGSFRLLHCYTCRNCSSVTIPLMLFGSNPYCSASRFFTALNASKKKLRESFWNTHQWQNQVEWDHPCYLLPPFFRVMMASPRHSPETSQKNKSLTIVSRKCTWKSLPRIRHKRAGMRKASKKSQHLPTNKSRAKENDRGKTQGPHASLWFEGVQPSI